jgi:hypothetical protein
MQETAAMTFDDDLTYTRLVTIANHYWPADGS